MKYSHPNTYTKLGFDIILQEAQKKAVSEDAREVLAQTQPFSETETILTELRKVSEFKDLLEYDDAFPFSGFSSMTFILHKASVEGNWLNTEELHRFYKWILIVKAVRNFITKRKEKYPELEKLIGSVPFAEHIIKEIEVILDETGNIRDNASPALLSIRRSIKEVAADLRKVLYRILRHANDNNWSVDKEITIRNDRLVIPVKAEAKGRISGFIHDISQSGNTIFMEPTESLILNNKLKELHLREQNEIIEILTQITEKIGEQVENLLHFKDVITEIDILRAKALLSIELNAVMPKIHPNGQRIVYKEAKFPLLQLRAKTQKFEVVPLNLTMEKKNRIILISGPNAGGKSISLKTIGLLQLMLQSGFLIPVDERSEFRFFDSLFIDLGDEQSVENDLSTYTSHLAQMRNMGDNMNHRSLFLIDEFGGGTDPQLGGAIAEAFLERFVRQGAYGIITTHYGNLKEYAQATDGIGNAAMEFNREELKPTYRLMAGLPGRSYAFEIAQRVGVHKTILQKAKQKLGTEQITSEQLISDLEKKNQTLTKQVAENERKAKELAQLQAKYEELKLKLTIDKQKIINEAKAEAKKLIQEANKKIEQTIREIRESEADKELTKKLRKELEEATPEMEEIELPVNPKEQPKEEVGGLKVLENEEIVVGDWAKLKTSPSYGKVLELQSNRCVVEIGDVRMKLKLNQIVKIEPPAEALKQKVKVVATSRLEKMKEVSTKIDVMGMRVEEALPLIEKKMDDALWAGLHTVSILHGKGTGALRDAIRKHLRDQRYVISLADAPYNEGGDGWTICSLKN
ncbi:MAG: endonuclease MutS2 [Bacteroidia bacterium]